MTLLILSQHTVDLCCSYLDLHGVQEARRAADECPSGEGQLRDGVVAALVKAASTVGDAGAAMEMGSH